MALKEKSQKKAQNSAGIITCHQKNIAKNSPFKQSKSSENNKIHQNQRLTVVDWLTRLKRHLKKLSQKQRDLIFSYLLTIRSAILSGTINDGLETLEKFEEVKESFEYNLLIKATPFILSNQPSKQTIFKWAKKLTLIRKNSWITALIRQREAIQVMPNSYKLVFDEEGYIADVGLISGGWLPPINPPDHNSHPENFLLEMEIYERVSLLTSIMAFSKKKRAPEYQKILKLQLSGVDVSAKHKKQLGIKGSEVANLKGQAKKFACKIFAEIFPELENAQSLYWAQKGKTWHVKRSTSEERRELNRDPNAGQKIACTTRVLKVYDGNFGKTYASPDSSVSALNSETSKFNEIA